MSTVQKTDLYFREGTSDKEYIATIVNEGSGYRVSCYYGRRGSTLKHTDKGFFYNYRDAQKKFEIVVGEKVAKGYKIKFDAKVEPSFAEPTAAYPTTSYVEPEIAEEVTAVDCRTSSEHERAEALARLKAACAN